MTADFMCLTDVAVLYSNTGFVASIVPLQFLHLWSCVLTPSVFSPLFELYSATPAAATAILAMTPLL